MAEPNISIRLEGRDVAPDDLGDPLRAMLVRQMAGTLRAKLRGVVCADHGQTPDVTITVVGGQQHVAVQGCCTALVDQTMQAILRR